MTDKPIYAWHFSTGELDFDMKGTQVVAGLKVSINDMPHLGYKGFHGCMRPLDALQYFAQRPNPAMNIIVSRVVLSGRRDISGGNLKQSTNIASETREHLWVADAKVTVEAFGIWCYMESLRVLRQDNYFITDVFDNAIKARIDNDDKLPELTKLARDEALVSAGLKQLLERLAMSLAMNPIEFVLANASNLVRASTHKYFEGVDDPEQLPSATNYIIDSVYDTVTQANHEKIYNMLMQLAPSGYVEP